MVLFSRQTKQMANIRAPNKQANQIKRFTSIRHVSFMRNIYGVCMHTHIHTNIHVPEHDSSICRKIAVNVWCPFSLFPFCHIVLLKIIRALILAAITS